jgi:AsmA protein
MSRKRTLILSLAAAVLLALAAAALLVNRIDLEEISQRLEVRLSAAFGLEVKLPGKPRLHLWPRPRAVLVDILVRDGEIEVLRVPRATATIAWLPLLRRQVQVSNLILEEAVLTVRRDADGRFTPRWKEKRKKAEPGQAQPPLPVAKITAEEGTIHFTDSVTDTVAELEGITLKLGDLHRGTDGRLAFAGEMRAKRLLVNRLEMRQLRGNLSAEKGVYRAVPMRGTLYGSEATFSLETDRSGALPTWRLELAAEGLSLAELFQSLAGRALYEGQVDMQMKLSAMGPGRLVNRLDGTVEVTGNRLTQHGFDLDGFVHSLRKSHSVDLVDVGAYLVVGPVGALLSRGFDLAVIYRELHQGKSQAIDRLAFHWTLENGIARAKDVALRTKENRVAVHGAIDLPQRRYEGITLAVLDSQGCATLTEEISGPLTKPSVQPISLLQTLTGPLAGLLEKVREIIDPGECKPFYEGTVTHPSSP